MASYQRVENTSEFEQTYYDDDSQTSISFGPYEAKTLPAEMARRALAANSNLSQNNSDKIPAGDQRS